MYDHCPSWALAWSYRKQNLLRELLSYKADILCLQEVQSDHYQDFLAPELQRAGYTPIYKKKTTELFTKNAYAIDGCATFFRRDKFSLVKKYEVEFNKAALSLSESLQVNNKKKAALGRLLKVSKPPCQHCYLCDVNYPFAVFRIGSALCRWPARKPPPNRDDVQFVAGAHSSAEWQSVPLASSCPR